MSVCTAVLVHSPMVGALTWTATAEELNRHGVATVVPDLAGADDHDGIVRAVATALRHTALRNKVATPIVLIGHSGAGRHLPGLASAVPGVALLVYVDAALATPGRSWFDDVPAERAATLRELADGQGRLPPWSEWFPPGALDALLPERGLRERFLAGVPRLPLSYFTEPAPPATWSGPQVYLRLSEAYLDEARTMRTDGVPVLTLPSHHLAMLTDPAAVAGAILRCLAT